MAEERVDIVISLHGAEKEWALWTRKAVKLVLDEMDATRGLVIEMIDLSRAGEVRIRAGVAPGASQSMRLDLVDPDAAELVRHMMETSARRMSRSGNAAATRSIAVYRHTTVDGVPLRVAPVSPEAPPEDVDGQEGTVEYLDVISGTARLAGGRTVSTSIQALLPPVEIELAVGRGGVRKYQITAASEAVLRDAIRRELTGLFPDAKRSEDGGS